MLGKYFPIIVGINADAATATNKYTMKLKNKELN
jgi:hypothetical protein